MLRALDLQTGKKLGRADLQRWNVAKKGLFGTGCAPLVLDGKVYVIVGGKSFGIGAFDTKTGKLKWGATKQEAGYSSRVQSEFGRVVADRETGKVMFALPWRSRSATSVNAATPVVDGKLLFLSASYGVGAVVLDFSSKPSRKLWANDETPWAHYATPVLKDGWLYGLHGQAQTGQELRAVEMKTMGSRSVTLIGDDQLFLRDDAPMFRIRPTPEKLDVLSNAKIVEGKVRAYLAVGSGLVFLRDTNVLTCLR